METIFNPQEILAIAIDVEANGENLYSVLEDKADDERIKAVWGYLKTQETLHRKIFKDMLDARDEYIVQEFRPGDYEAYLNAIACEYIITQKLTKEKTSQGFGSSLEAIKFAIYIEKESILVYTALKDCIVSKKQDVINKIIAEEKNHLADLVALKRTIKN